MNWIVFLIIAVIVAVVCLGLGGAWLLPMLGVEGLPARMISAGVAGAIIAVIYMRMRGRSGA